ncbi:MAG: hypothetical protein KH086_00510 [Coprobacillus sp.]|jgi:hypothetical protein|nr:hypothetical protein [Coprobacillus sp.]
MNSSELARKIIDCLSDGYDDEENREEAETELYNELSQLNGNNVVKAALLRLCETIEELIVYGKFTIYNGVVKLKAL